MFSVIARLAAKIRTFNVYSLQWSNYKSAGEQWKFESFYLGVALFCFEIMVWGSIFSEFELALTLRDHFQASSSRLF